LNTTFQDMAFARYALKKYLKAQFQHAQAPTMLIAVNFDKVTVLHDYTQDGNAILNALNHHLTAYPWNLQRGEDKIRTLALSLGVLEQVTQATAGHPGHKNLIWVGKGFPGLDLASPNISNDASLGITSAMHQAVNMMRDSRVTLYTIDPTILSSAMAVTTDADSVQEMDDVPGAATPDPFGGEVSFTNLAIKSGGKAFYSRNDVDREVGESVRDGVNYYTISYRPTDVSDADKPYRKIHIGFTLPGLHAAYRDGYYSKAPEVPSSPGTRMTYDMNAAEESTMVYTGLSVVAMRKPGTSDTYLVGVPQQELKWTRDGDQESAKLLLIAAALDGKNGTLARDTLDATAHRAVNTGASATASGLARIEVQFPTPKGAYRLRFVVRSLGDGRMGTADIAVPDAPPLPPTSR
jgi:VWFA-related protein